MHKYYTHIFIGIFLEWDVIDNKDKHIEVTVHINKRASQSADPGHYDGLTDHLDKTTGDNNTI